MEKINIEKLNELEKSGAIDSKAAADLRELDSQGVTVEWNGNNYSYKDSSGNDYLGKTGKGTKKGLLRGINKKHKNISDAMAALRSNNAFDASAEKLVAKKKVKEEEADASPSAESLAQAARIKELEAQLVAKTGKGDEDPEDKGDGKMTDSEYEAWKKKNAALSEDIPEIVATEEVEETSNKIQKSVPLYQHERYSKWAENPITFKTFFNGDSRTQKEKDIDYKSNVIKFNFLEKNASKEEIKVAFDQYLAELKRLNLNENTGFLDEFSGFSTLNYNQFLERARWGKFAKEMLEEKPKEVIEKSITKVTTNPNDSTFANAMTDFLQRPLVSKSQSTTVPIQAADSSLSNTGRLNTVPTIKPKSVIETRSPKLNGTNSITNFIVNTVRGYKEGGKLVPKAQHGISGINVQALKKGLGVDGNVPKPSKVNLPDLFKPINTFNNDTTGEYLSSIGTEPLADNGRLSSVTGPLSEDFTDKELKKQVRLQKRVDNKRGEEVNNTGGEDPYKYMETPLGDFSANDVVSAGLHTALTAKPWKNLELANREELGKAPLLEGQVERGLTSATMNQFDTTAANLEARRDSGSDTLLNNQADLSRAIAADNIRTQGVLANEAAIVGQEEVNRGVANENLKAQDARDAQNLGIRTQNATEQATFNNQKRGMKDAYKNSIRDTLTKTMEKGLYNKKVSDTNTLTALENDYNAKVKGLEERELMAETEADRRAIKGERAILDAKYAEDKKPLLRAQGVSLVSR